MRKQGGGESGQKNGNLLQGLHFLHFLHNPANASKQMTAFYLDKRTDKHGDCPIRVSARAAGGRLLTSIGYSINPGLWDNNAQQVKPGSKNAPNTNAKGIPATTINARIAAIKAAFAQIEATPGAATISALQAALDAVTGKAAKESEAKAKDRPAQQPKSIVATCFDLFLREESGRNQWSPATLAKMRTFQKSLDEYNNRLTFADFNESGIDGYINYLRKQGQQETSIQKRYGNLKWFLAWAIRKGYCKETAIQAYRPKFKVLAKPVIFLTRQELLKLYEYEIPANQTKVTLTNSAGKEYEKIVKEAGGLAKARDLFCFCAFTSLRYSDMAALKRSDIVGNSIIVTTQKTNDRLEIPLNNYSRAILDKYAGLNDPRGRALPVISNQKMNDYLKDLCELCDFRELVTKVYYRDGQRIEETREKWELIGTHAARRTFICYALTKGIAPQIVMKWTGHSDYKAMKPYIDIAGADAAAAMQLMND